MCSHLKKQYIRAMLSMMKRMISVAALFIYLMAGTTHAMTYEDESKIANDFISYLDSRGFIIHDIEITSKLQFLVDQLADHIKDPVYSFKIHLVKDRSINAFAIPGGQIFINLGTVLFVQDLNELAGVIGHEMGHCQLRHIPEDMETQKRISMATLLGVLAGTILSAKNPQVGTALIYSSLGGSQNIRLKYSRKHEFEADEFSRNILPLAGFDPSGLSRFLIRLRTYEGTYGVPAYLLTHPYAKQRIASIDRQPGKPKPDERYWALYSSAIAYLLPLEEARSRADSLPGMYKKFVLGVVAVRSGLYREALAYLKGIDLPQAYEWYGIALYHMGKYKSALPYLENYEASARSRLAIANILDSQGKPQQAIKVLQPFQKYHPRVAYLLGKLYQETGKHTLSHVAYARYFYYTGHYKSSYYHIREALDSKGKLDASTKDELSFMLKEIKKAEKKASE